MANTNGELWTVYELATACPGRKHKYRAHCACVLFPCHRGEGVCSDCHRDLMLRVSIPTHSSHRPRSHPQRVVRHRRVDSRHYHVQSFLGANDEGIVGVGSIHDEEQAPWLRDQGGCSAPLYESVFSSQVSLAWKLAGSTTLLHCLMKCDVDLRKNLHAMSYLYVGTSIVQGIN